MATTTKQKSEAFINFCSTIGVNHNNVPEINTWTDVCKLLKLNPKKKPDVSAYPKALRKYAEKHFRWLLIITALNGGKKLDYLNQEQKKYWSYVWRLVKDKKKPSGFGFSNSHSVLMVRLRLSPLAFALLIGTLQSMRYADLKKNTLK